MESSNAALTSALAALLSCDADGRRMQADDTARPVAGSPTEPPPIARKIIADYLARTPSLADKMDADELLGHFHKIEQDFGPPARA